MSLNMADSSDRSGDYARSRGGEAIVPPQRSGRRLRRLRWSRCWPTLGALLLVALFVSFGQWQWNKARLKQDLQTQLDERSHEPALTISSAPVDPQALRFHTVRARGTYEPQYQILIDNRIHREQAGYHVLTPLHLEGSAMRVLVNRGWVPALAEHRRSPQVTTPGGVLEVAGLAVVPGTRYLTLGPDDAGASESGWQTVWQNLDLARYAKAVAFPVQPIVIELAADSPAGGFARAWSRPDERIERHLGYAYQWWGFAGATVIIWLFVSLRRQP